MKPVIGITASTKEGTTTLKNDNYQAISATSGIPIILPNLLNEGEIETIANCIDGLLLSGGGDIDPTLFNEEPHVNLGQITPERDYFELTLIKNLLEKNKPILAICRGCQILNIAGGGDMYQDIYSQKAETLLQHSQNAPRSHGSHFVEVVEGSLLFKLTQSKRFKVNSFHHQAVREMGEGFVISATASDGVIEAFESAKHRFVLGIQWHPECMIGEGDPFSRAIFEAFVEACKEQKRRNHLCGLGSWNAS